MIAEHRSTHSSLLLLNTLPIKVLGSFIRNIRSLRSLKSSSLGVRRDSQLRGLSRLPLTLIQPSSRSIRLLTPLCSILFVISDTRNTVSWSLSHGNASGRRNQSILVTMLAARRAGSLLLVVTLKPFVLGRTSGVALDAVMVNVRMSIRSHKGSSR
ncbi:hypothetical protein IWW34DRAFT_756954, partial [Fusarium oxysporum f. sp. albedinis]